MRAALLLLAMTGTAHAEVCSVDDITTRVERLTGRVVDATTFTVRAEQRDNAFVATVQIGGGTRDVSEASCDAVLDAAALVIVMAAPDTPQLADKPPTREAADGISKQSHPESLTQRESVIEMPTAPSRDRRTLWVAAGLASGGQETTGVGNDWRRGSALYRVELRATRVAEIEVTPLATATIWETSAAALACTHASALLTCAVATAGLSLGSSDHLEGAHVAVLPLLAVGARVEWDYPEHGLLALRLAAEGAVHATTTHLDVNDMPVWTSRRFEGLASGALILRFP